MAVDQQFIKNVCSTCPHRNILDEGLSSLVKKVAEIEIGLGHDVCGKCGCNLGRMEAAGKKCPIGKSGENRGLWKLLTGK